MIAKSNAGRIIRMATKMEFWELNYLINHLLNVELPAAQKRQTEAKGLPGQTAQGDLQMKPEAV